MLQIHYMLLVSNGQIEMHPTVFELNDYLRMPPHSMLVFSLQYIFHHRFILLAFHQYSTHYARVFCSPVPVSLYDKAVLFILWTLSSYNISNFRFPHQGCQLWDHNCGWWKPWWNSRHCKAVAASIWWKPCCKYFSRSAPFRLGLYVYVICHGIMASWCVCPDMIPAAAS